MASNKRSKNPLYVVTNNGKDVQEARNVVDAWIKKMGLEPIVEFINSMLEILLAQVHSYAFFQVLQEFIDKLVVELEKWAKRIDPVLAFSLFHPKS